jgi:hypothetical protein
MSTAHYFSHSRPCGQPLDSVGLSLPVRW